MSGIANNVCVDTHSIAFYAHTKKPSNISLFLPFTSVKECVHVCVLGINEYTLIDMLSL